MGDTEIFGDMALINEIHAPQIGIVPMGDRFTMGARTAALACRKYFQLRDGISLPLRHVPDARPERGCVRRRDEGRARHRAQGRAGGDGLGAKGGRARGL